MQSDFNLHCPQKLLVLSSVRKELMEKVRYNQLCKKCKKTNLHHDCGKSYQIRVYCSCMQSHRMNKSGRTSSGTNKPSDKMVLGQTSPEPGCMHCHKGI